jgi:hypothetical protein
MSSDVDGRPRARILLVHLVSNGDCLLATTVARQIKEDFPGCHLTWAISFKCKQVIENNPFVDDIWSIEYGPDELPIGDVWYRTKAQAEARLRKGELDKIFYTQLFPDNFNNFDGTTRTSIFRSYPGKITVPVQPVFRLFDREVERVSAFAARHTLDRYKHVVLFECAPGSNQSFLSPALAIRLAERVTTERTQKDTVFVISSHLPFQSTNPAVVDGSPLTYRENAALSRHCTLLLGGSSGLSWLTTSSDAKKLPTIQFMSRNVPWYSFASMIYDHEFFGLDTSHILETDVRNEDAIAEMIKRTLAQGSFDGIAQHTFAPSVEQIYDLYRMKGRAVDVKRVLRNFKDRNRLVPVSELAFYRGLARVVLRAQGGRLARRIAAVAKRVLTRAR